MPRVLARAGLCVAALLAAAAEGRGAAPSASPSPAPPPVSAAAPARPSEPEPTLAQFAAHPHATLPALSPDGREMAIVFRTGDTRAIAVRPTDADDTSPPRLLGALRSRPRWLRWTKQDRVLVAIERFQPRVYLDAVDGPVRPPTPMYDRAGRIVGWQVPPQPPRKEMPAGKVQYVYSFNAIRGGERHLGKRWEDPVPIQDDVLGWLPTDPLRILVSYDPAERFGPQRVPRPSVQAMSVTTGGLRRVVGEDRRIRRWFADLDGDVRLGEGSHEDHPVLYRRDGRNLVEVKTYVTELEGSVRFAAYSYDPDVIYVWGNVSGRQALLALRLSDESVTGVFAHPEVDVTGPLVFDERQRKLVGVGYVDDVPRIHVLDETLAHERELMERALPGTVIEYVSESEDQKRVLVRASSDVSPPKYYVYEREKKELRHELSEYPQLESVSLAPMERVTLWARDGLPIPSYLTRPPGKPTGGPAIIWVHDGPDQRAMRRFDPLVQWLARRGITVLEPNYRGSAGFGERHRSLGYGDWGGAMQNDLDDAAAWLVTEGIADAKRIGIYGRGYGGYAALIALEREGTPFRAAASHGGPVDLVRLLDDDDDERVLRDWSRVVRGARPLKKDRLVALSPLTHAATMNGPVLLLHSAFDEDVRFDQAKELAEALEKAGKRVELVEFPRELHELALEENRVLWFERLTRFFERELAPPAPPEPPTPQTAKAMR